jgi:hypothetical protein
VLLVNVAGARGLAPVEQPGNADEIVFAACSLGRIYEAALN